MRLGQHNTSLGSEIQNSLSANVAYRGRGGNSNNRGCGCGNTKNRLICQLCGRVGYIDVKCFHRFDVSYVGPEQSNNNTTNTANNNSHPGASSQAYLSSTQEDDADDDSLVHQHSDNKRSLVR